MVASLDDAVVVWIATHRWHPLDPVFVGLGDVDRVGAVWVVLALAVTYARRRHLATAILAAALVAVVGFCADAASFGVKDLVTRPRPFVTHPEIHPLYVVHSSSFPAGHAATAFAGATILSYLGRRWLPWFALLALAIAFSRVYVGVHYPSDVLAGAALGTTVGLVAIPVVRRLLGDASRSNRRRSDVFRTRNGANTRACTGSGSSSSARSWASWAASFTPAATRWASCSRSRSESSR